MKSHIETYHLDTEIITSVYESDRLLEAPNWSRDGDFLIVNAGGRLYRLALQAPTALHLIDTGIHVQCNNDHGISPDGQQLVISDKTKTGASCIYVLPATGGEPRQVTTHVPSYWHGWSPDGGTLAYTAKRNENFNIYTIDVAGGEEFAVTQGTGHKDGPDYTRDGQWIWFNSDHGGGMDLWRVRPDGSDLQQMTDDSDVNWFPHPSPTSDQVLYLAYEPGTAGHPANKPVKLKILDTISNNIRTVRDFIGGQGSINVPNWHPDGRQFAYIRYTNT